MIRLYKQVADYIAFWMVYLRDKEMYKQVNARDYVYNTYGTKDRLGPSSEAAMIYNIFRNSGPEETSHSEVTTDLINQIYGVNAGIKVKHDADLIDTIVRLLGLPYGQNAISGKTMDALRKAILVPDELAGLKARLDRDERACASCGRELVQNEMVTIGRNSTGRVSLHCAVCSTPAVIACQSCKEGKSVLPKLTVKHLKKSVNCDACSSGTPVEPGLITDVRIGEGGPQPVEPNPFRGARMAGRTFASPANTTTTTTSRFVSAVGQADSPFVTSQRLAQEMRRMQQDEAMQLERERARNIVRQWGDPAPAAAAPTFTPEPPEPDFWDGPEDMDPPDDGA